MLFLLIYCFLAGVPTILILFTHSSLFTFMAFQLAKASPQVLYMK